MLIFISLFSCTCMNFKRRVWIPIFQLTGAICCSFALFYLQLIFRFVSIHKILLKTVSSDTTLD